MIKLSYRDELTPEELTIKDSIGDTMSRGSLDAAWSEFAEMAWSSIERAIDEYVDSEFKKTQTYTQLKFVNDTFDYLTKNKSLSPEKERQLSDRGAELDDQASEFKRDLNKRLYNVKFALFHDIINSKVD
jgi:hypothetical protein